MTEERRRPGWLLEQAVAPRALLAGVALGFLACSAAGWFAARHNHFHHFDINKVPGDKLLEGFLVALAMHFALRRGDRIYFPVWSQVRKREA